MIDTIHEEKLKRFAADRVMTDAVYSVLLTAFLDGKREGVEEKAAAWIAIEQLKRAWGEIDKYRPVDSKGDKTTRQVGL